MQLILAVVQGTILYALVVMCGLRVWHRTPILAHCIAAACERRGPSCARATDPDLRHLLSPGRGRSAWRPGHQPRGQGTGGAGGAEKGARWAASPQQ